MASILRACAANSGQKRRLIPQELLYKLIFKSGKTTEQVIQELNVDYLPQEPKVQLLIDSLVKSNRGITR